MGFARWPGRRFHQLCSRALQIALQAIGGGWELWSLSSFRTRFDSGFRTLRRPPVYRFRCACCGGLKLPVEGITADAGQFYEQADLMSVSRAVDFLSAELRDRNLPSTVTVAKHRQVRGRLGGNAGVETTRTICFSVSTLIMVLFACLSANLIRLGDAVLWIRALPIGGFMSKIAASLVLIQAETVWERQPALWEIAGFRHLRGFLWKEVVLSLRYVDDILLVSGMLCQPCLSSLPEIVYPVSFDVGQERDVLPFVDVHVNLRLLGATGDPSASLFLVDKNDAWARGEAPQGRHRFPPGCRGLRVDRAHLTSYFTGRLARMEELRLPEPERLRSLSLRLLELRRHRYPWSRLRAAVYGVKASRSGVHILRKAFVAVRSADA